MSRNLVHHSLLNFVTQTFLMVLTFVCLPIVVKGLAEEKFGLLSIVWAIVGYFTLLDFGIGRATTKFLAEAAARNDEKQIWQLIKFSVYGSLGLGIIGAIILFLLAPFLIKTVFHIGAHLSVDALNIFYIAAIGIPFMLLFGVVRGIQMAFHRFDVMNMLQAIIGIIQWAGSVVLVFLGKGLWEIVCLTIGVRIIVTIVSIVTLKRLIPKFSSMTSFNDFNIRRFFSFSGWIAVSQFISPLFSYLDRIFVGAFLTLSAVTFYSVPQEALTRLLIVPMSLTSTLFPVMSEGKTVGASHFEHEALYFRSVRYLFLFLLPLMFVLCLFANEILRLWMGNEFVVQSGLSFRVMIIGIFAASLAQVPVTALQSFGRADLTAKFHLFELAFMVGLNLLLIPRLGIVGAAVTWSLRLLLDAFLLFSATNRTMVDSKLALQIHLKPNGLLIFFGLSILAVFFLSIFTMTMIKIILGGVVCTIYIITVWKINLDSVERAFFLSLPAKILKREVTA